MLWRVWLENDIRSRSHPGGGAISPKYLDTVGRLARNIPDLVQGMDLLQRGFKARYAAARAARACYSLLPNREVGMRVAKANQCMPVRVEARRS